MNYKDLINRYKKGLVNVEEKQLIEEELEKYQAIDEYFNEVFEEELDYPTHEEKHDKLDEETIKLRKSVNGRLRKVIYASVAIVITLIITIFYIVSPLVDTLYYDPSKFTVGKMFNDISFDVLAITELNMPGLTPSTVFVDEQGFGRYDVRYSYRNVFTDESYNVNHKIEPGKMQSWFNSPTFSQGVFLDLRYFKATDLYIGEKKQNIINHLKKLNPVTYVSMEIMFENDLTMEELYNLQLKYPDIEFEWAGIRTDFSDKNINDVLGIKLRGKKTETTLLADEASVSPKYPGFFIMGWLVNPVGYDKDSPLEAQAYEQHYISLLEYVIDRKEAVKVLEHKTKNEFYKSALEYAKQEGVKTYGVLLFAEVEDLLTMIENELIIGLELNNALVSRSYIR